MLNADTITVEQFMHTLERYPALLLECSNAKGTKPGQESLSQLDEFRFTAAPETYGRLGLHLETAGPSTSDEEGTDIFRRLTIISKEHVVRLVKWKLTHGKFRPSLLGLVNSNEPAAIKRKVQEGASKHLKYRFLSTTHRSGPAEHKDVGTGLDALTELRGIGPATASLLLAMYDPEDTAFFSDELFWWLCCGGRREKIKYSKKEYAMLGARAAGLLKRLRDSAGAKNGIGAREMEKVAWVLMREALDQDREGPASAKSGNGKGNTKNGHTKVEAEVQAERDAEEGMGKPAERKVSSWKSTKNNPSGSLPALAPRRSNRRTHREAMADEPENGAPASKRARR